MTSLRDHALALAQHGLRVFPLAPGTKIPEHSSNWQKIATSDPATVAALWTCPITGWDQPFNIGIATGGGLVVIDVDVKDGKSADEKIALLESVYDEIPKTFTVETPGYGRHLYFWCNDDRRIGNSASKILKGVDVRANGGYVVAPGSRIGSRTYFRSFPVRWANDGAASEWRPAALPEGLLEAVSRHARSAVGLGNDGRPLVDEDAPDAIARATEWLRSSAPDHGTFAVAAKVKDFGVSEPKALELLMTEWVEPRNLGKDLDHVAFRVGNAYRYGKSAVGVASPEAEFGPEEAVDRRKPKPDAKRPKLYYEKWRDAVSIAGAPYLIKGWYDSGSMVVTYGESNSGKTNVVLSQAFAIATGQEWAGARVRQGLVVYVAAEGGRGLRKRIAAHHKKYGVSDVPFALVPCPVDLLRPAGDTKALIDLVKAAEADFDRPCVMVVLDTLSRVLAGGNENAPDDMGALVIHCDRIREATGATVHLIHHSGKNAAAGARGHSSLRAATDSEIEVVDQTIVGKKQRDMDRLRSLSFTYEAVELGKDEDGDPITSIVTHVAKVSEFESKVTTEQKHMLDALVGLVLQDLGKDPATFDGVVTPDMAAVKITSRSWRSALKSCDKSPGAARKAFQRDKEALLASCDIECVTLNARQFLVNLVL